MLTISDLPDDMLSVIFEPLGFQDRALFRRVCTRWNRVLKEEGIPVVYTDKVRAKPYEFMHRFQPDAATMLVATNAAESPRPFFTYFTDLRFVNVEGNPYVTDEVMEQLGSVATNLRSLNVRGCFNIQNLHIFLTSFPKLQELIIHEIYVGFSKKYTNEPEWNEQDERLVRIKPPVVTVRVNGYTSSSTHVIVDDLIAAHSLRTVPLTRDDLQSLHEHYAAYYKTYRAMFGGVDYGRLSAALRLGVLTAAVGQVESAIQVLKDAFDDAISQLDLLDDTSYQKVTLVMQLMRDILVCLSS